MSFVNVAPLTIARVPSGRSERVERNSSMSSTCRRGVGEYTYYAPPSPGGQADFSPIRNDTHYSDLRMSTADGSTGRIVFFRPCIPRLEGIGIIGGCRKMDKLDSPATQLHHGGVPPIFMAIPRFPQRQRPSFMHTSPKTTSIPSRTLLPRISVRRPLLAPSCTSTGRTRPPSFTNK